MEHLNKIVDLMDMMIHERSERGICNTQSDILKNGASFSSDVEFYLKLGDRYQYYSDFRSWFMYYVYDEINDYDSAVVIYNPFAYNSYKKIGALDKEYIKRSAVEQNSLDTIRRFFTFKRPYYDVSIFYNGDRFDVDNVAKPALDLIQCANSNNCLKHGYRDVLDSYVPIIRNDRQIINLHVYKYRYKRSNIPIGITTMIMLMS